MYRKLTCLSTQNEKKKTKKIEQHFTTFQLHQE